MIAVTRSGRPRRLLAREQARHVVQVAQLLDRQLLVEQDEPRLVAEELAHGDSCLAILRELGPVSGDRGVVVEPAARLRHRQRHRREAFGAGHDDDHRVFVPGCVALGRAVATPQIDDLFAAPVRRDSGADLAAFGEVALELGAHLFEAGGDQSSAVSRGFPASDDLAAGQRTAQERDGQHHDPQEENADVDALPNPYPRRGQICGDSGAI